ncbi:MAG: hypothetical protein JWM34_3699 [Ilumatobacteraceae bacterium]|nr:hypothetical protein [Ilumatobacteraceae bacterium]
MIKDYVKSMKHYWHEAVYVPDVSDEVALRSIVDRFVELRGDDLVGGIVIRQFESFDTGEARTWWINGECRLVTGRIGMRAWRAASASARKARGSRCAWSITTP